MTSQESSRAIGRLVWLVASLIAAALSYLIIRPKNDAPVEPSHNGHAQTVNNQTGGPVPLDESASLQHQDLEVPPSVGRRESESFKETVHCSLLVLDDGNDPIEGASVEVDGSNESYKTDKNGRATISSEPTRALVLADGFDAKTCEIWPGRQTVVLTPHPGVEVQVVWDGSSEPVANARIRTIGIWKEWKERALERAHGESLITNESGLVVVPTLMVDGEYVVIEVRHPSGATAVQELWGLGLEGVQRRRVTIRLPDRADRFRVNLSDPEGIPYEGAMVTVRLWRREYSQRTNDEGDADIPLAVEFESPDDFYGIAYEATLPDGRRKWIEETWEEFDATGRRLLVVDHLPVHGRILGGNPQSFEVATAAACIPGNPGADYGARPNNRERLQWLRVDESGRFKIPTGWQGRRSCVLIKHAQSGVIVGSVLVGEENDPVEFRVPPTCKIDCQVSPADVAGDLKLELRPADRWAAASKPAGRGTIEFDIAGGKQVLEVPRSRYIASLRKGGLKWTVGTVDATGDECRVEVEIPSQGFLAGSIQGTKSGPLGNIRLVITDQEKRILASTRTNGGGEFQAHYLGEMPVTVHFQWPRDVFDLWREAIDPIAITNREARVDVIRPEAVMQLVEPPTSPLAGIEETSIEYLGSEGGQVLWAQSKEIGKIGNLNLIVPPGTYSVKKTVRSSMAYELSVQLAVGDERVVVCDAEEAAIVRVDVVAPRIESEQWVVVRVQGPDGEEAEEREPFVDREQDPHLNVLVRGGLYQIEVECMGRDPSGDEYAIGSWNGEAVISPGQSVAVTAIIQ